MGVVIDAGPMLTFLAARQHRMLFSTIGAVQAPETVIAEITRKVDQPGRLRPGQATWRKVMAGGQLVRSLSDDATPELVEAVERLTSIPFEDRMRRSKDLGETMVVAHAAVLVRGGIDVTVVIDDRGGQRLAAAEQRVIDTSRVDGWGTLRLVDTPATLARAVVNGVFTDRRDLRARYAALRACDDGLPPIEATGLLDCPPWPR